MIIVVLMYLTIGLIINRILWPDDEYKLLKCILMLIWPVILSMFCIFVIISMTNRDEV